MPATLFTNANIHTLDGRSPEATSILVDNGVILAVGDIGETRGNMPLGTTSRDLGGRTVLPGFTDAHIHTASLARALNEVDMRGTASLEEALDRLRAIAPRYPAGDWIFGGWWDHNAWDVPCQPHRDALDSIFPANPVALTSSDGHTVWANSLALRQLGISADSLAPAGGENVKDRDGQLTGILRESSVFAVRELAAKHSGDLPTQLLQAQEYLLSRGVTTVHDIDGRDALHGYQQLRDEGRLALRVHKLLAHSDLGEAIDAGIRTGDGDQWISIGAVKMFADGAAGSHTCLMSKPFAGEPTNVGMEVTGPAQLAVEAERAALAGIAVAVHAIGDRANHQVLDALERLVPLTRRHRLRPRIEHSQYLLPDDVRRFAELGVTASMQPQHCPSDIPLQTMIAGHELASYAWRSLLDSGATVVFGSDSPVEEPNPFHGLHAATTRTTRSGEPRGGWQPRERISLAEALRAYCTTPAEVTGETHLKGTLTPGKVADFVVVDRDIFDVDDAALFDTQVDLTVVAGEPRYRRPGSGLD